MSNIKLNTSSAMSLQRLQGFRLSCEDVKSSISIIIATSNIIKNKLWNSSWTFVIGVCCILLLLKKKTSKPKSEKRLVSSPCSIGKHLLLKHE
jgi:hypothetical protein